MGKSQRGQHEDDCCAGGQLVHEGVAAAGTEYGLAAAGTEGSTHLGTFARLEKNDADHGDTDKYVEKYNDVVHSLVPFIPVTGLN